MNDPTRDGVQEIALHSWQHFQDHILREEERLGDFIWRGQKKADWLLESVLRRKLKESALPENEWKQRAATLESEFRNAARGRRGPNPKNLNNSNDAWALGRHYGLATPFLDWTKSPFVAAYFAFVEEWIKAPDNALRAVWGLKCSQELKNRLRIVEPETDENSRLISQRGLFTMTIEIDDDLELWVKREFKECSSPRLIKFTLPDSERISALRILNKMNINHLTLFPDLEGAAKFCNMRLEIINY